MYLVVRKNSTEGAYIVERAALGWQQSKADIAGVYATECDAEAAADAINECEQTDCPGCPDCMSLEA
jgi:hypothetical protein